MSKPRDAIFRYPFSLGKDKGKWFELEHVCSLKSKSWLKGLSATKCTLSHIPGLQEFVAQRTNRLFKGIFKKKPTIACLTYRIPWGKLISSNIFQQKKINMTLYSMNKNKACCTRVNTPNLLRAVGLLDKPTNSLITLIVDTCRYITRDALTTILVSNVNLQKLFKQPYEVFPSGIVQKGMKFWPRDLARAAKMKGPKEKHDKHGILENIQEKMSGDETTYHARLLLRPHKHTHTHTETHTFMCILRGHMRQACPLSYAPHLT